MNTTEEKYRKLQQIIKRYKKAIVAFSAGVDSTLLLKVAYDQLGNNILAVTAISPSYPRRELEEALGFVTQHAIPHRTINTKEFNLEAFQRNSPDRCYHCKSELYQKLQTIAAAEGYEAVFDGSNADDENDFRPGTRAVREKKAVCPLREAGLTKDEIRELSKTLGLPTYNKVASPCLSSRFPYGTPITMEKMARVEKAEDFLREAGFELCRVRYHEEIARIEIPAERFDELLQPELRLRIVSEIKNLGFKYVALDIQGFRTGSLNEVLNDAEKQKFKV
jgi:pyridinium-3,5-biscarboxylic acid mononucleotide sulfurtransferase